jgi:hypothetical protein
MRADLDFPTFKIWYGVPPICAGVKEFDLGRNQTDRVRFRIRKEEGNQLVSPYIIRMPQYAEGEGITEFVT